MFVSGRYASNLTKQLMHLLRLQCTPTKTKISITWNKGIGPRITKQFKNQVKINLELGNSS